MLEQGAITPSHSPWASPIVLVKKKDGSYRFYVDYRKLNGITIRDAHPLPRVDDLLDALNGSKIFSTLDLRQGYWQVSMDPQDSEKTAFVLYLGHVVSASGVYTDPAKIESVGKIAAPQNVGQPYPCIPAQHRPGTQNCNADAFSRLPFEGQNSTIVSDTSNANSQVPTSPVCLTMLASENNIQQAQLRDLSISKVLELKELGFANPPYFVWARDKQLSAYWNCWDDLFIIDGVLVKSASKTTNLPDYAVVVPEELVQQVTTGLHSRSFGGHLVISKTISRAKGRFFWPQMDRCIREFVQLCQVCGEIKASPGTNKAALRPIDVSEPFVFWAMDYMGPLPETSRSNNHVLVVMDHFTKWCEAFPTKDKKASTVANILVSRIFSRFGPPVAIHSDQGANFESNLIHEVCNIMGIHKSRTTAYHPQGDGLVERQNCTLQNILSSFASQHRDDWDLWIDITVYAYNTSPQESTGFSPYELMFGHQARFPLQQTLEIPLKNPSSQSEYASSLRKAFKSTRIAVQEHLAKAR
eukprot:gene15550-biopygen13260